MDKGDKTEFCKSLEWKLKLQWFDKTGIAKLKNGCIARIELETHGISGHYQGFLVTILNPKEGKVDAKYFQFDDYLDRTGAGRKDGRHAGQPNEYGTGPKEVCFQLINYIGWRWYIAEPRTTRPFCEAVEAYVKAFS